MAFVGEGAFGFAERRGRAHMYDFLYTCGSRCVDDGAGAGDVGPAHAFFVARSNDIDGGGVNDGVYPGERSAIRVGLGDIGFRARERAHFVAGYPVFSAGTR